MATATAFKHRVVEVVRAIPFGSVLTYGQVAVRAGNPKAARAVGTIMRGNKHSFFNTLPDDHYAVPCHRVVATNLKLGGFNGGEKAKQQLLQVEGWRILADMSLAR